MNKIFKVVYNKATGRYEVASELAKSAVKASSTSSSEKITKILPVSILATMITPILASSVSYAATINYKDIPKQGVAVVYDAHSGILRNMSLEGTETPGVLSATNATSSLNKMLDHYKGFFHVNAEGNKIGDEKADGSKYTENTGIWADWLTAAASKVEAEKNSQVVVFSDNLGKFTEKSGAQGSRSVAVGVYANALAEDSIAIGSRANVNNYWGNQSREAVNGIAIGKQAQVEGATNSIAFGTNAKLLASTPYSLKPDNSIAIGNNSTVNWASNAITLGNNASITGSHAVNGAWKGSDNSIAIGNETTVGREDTVAIGSSVNAQRENTVAIGTSVTATRENSVVIGQNASATRERVVAIGAYATATGDRTVAIGPEATANGSKSIVIGGIGDAKAIAEKDQAIVIGNGAQATDNATYSITLGNNAKTAGATGISIGDRAQVVASAANGIALGQSAVANNSGDIAIGQSSSTSTKHTVTDIKIGDATLSKGVAATDNGTVSFGNNTVKRQIQNVGAGEISDTSSDVITGSQLYHVIKAADEIAKTEYKFTVGGSDVRVMGNKGLSTKNNESNTLNFAAADGLDVEGANGTVTYKLNAESKKAIADAKTAATTVTNKLNEINQSVARAETAAGKAEAAKTDAVAAKDAAVTAKTDAVAAKDAAVTAKTDAVAAKDAAVEAKDAAVTAKTDAVAAKDAAVTAKTDAVAAKDAAVEAKDAAVTAKTDAVAAKDAAVTAKTDAVAAKDAAVTAKTDAVAAKDAAVTAKTDAVAAKDAAVTAKTDAVAAKDAAVTAKTDAVAAKDAAVEAKDAAVTAKTDAVAAKDAAVAAKDAAVTAQGKAEAAKTGAEAARDEVAGAVQKIESSGLIGKDGKVSFAADNAGSRDSARAVGIDSTALGYGSEAKGNDSTVIGNHAFASGTGSVALGNGSVAAEDYTVSVGSAGNERRITNVQSPRHATDAANKAYVDSIRDEWKSADKKLRGGVAGATAIANLPQANGSSNSMLSLAVGNYSGQNAFAIGYSKVSDNNRVTLKISGSASTAGDYNVGAGIGFQW